MTNQEGIKNLEEAQLKAGEYFEKKDEVSRLLSSAGRKAEANYAFLLAPWESLQILLRMVGCWLRARYSPPIPTVLGAIAALIYLAEPFDLIPDSLPVFGLADDGALIAAVAKMHLTEISRFRKWEISRKHQKAAM